MNYGAQLKKLRIAAGKTVAQAAADEGVSKRLWEYWEANEKLPPAERDAITRERLLARWKTKAHRPGSSSKKMCQRATSARPTNRNEKEE